MNVKSETCLDVYGVNVERKSQAAWEDRNALTSTVTAWMSRQQFQKLVVEHTGTLHPLVFGA